MEKKPLKDILNDFKNSDAYKTQLQLIEERKKTIKRGDNVVHLDYLGELNENELIEIDNKLKTSNLELSYYDKSGIPYNCFDEFSLITSFVIGQPLIMEFLKSAGMSAGWDSIKWVLLFSWEKLRGKKYNKYVGSEFKEEKIKFGFSACLDENTQFNFELHGDFDKEIIEKSLDQVFNFLKEQKANESYQIPDYVKYSKKHKKWKKINVMKEIEEKAKNKEKK